MNKTLIVFSAQFDEATLNEANWDAAGGSSNALNTPMWWDVDQFDCEQKESPACAGLFYASRGNSTGRLGEASFTNGATPKWSKYKPSGAF